MADYSEIVFAVSFLLNLTLVGGLWWIARRSVTAGRFWGTIAAGWTLNLLGNVAWIAYDVIVGMSLPPLSWVDSLYLGRYLLVILALWRYPLSWPWRRALDFVAVVLVATLIAWVGLFQPTLASTERSWDYFVGVAMYPILDAGLIYAAGMRWWRAPSAPLKRAMGLFCLAMVVYGVANWINFGVRMASPDADSGWATLFWLSTDVFTGLAAVLLLKQERKAA